MSDQYMHLCFRKRQFSNHAKDGGTTRPPGYLSKWQIYCRHGLGASGTRSKGVGRRIDSIFNPGTGAAGVMRWGRTGQRAIRPERGTEVATLVSSRRRWWAWRLLTGW